MDKKERTKKINYCIVFTYLSVFFFMIGDAGPYMMRDSYSFIQMANNDISIRYGLYALFIRMCVLVFGEPICLYAVYIIQGIIAVISTFLITEFIRKTYSMAYGFSVIFCFLLTLPYGYSLPENVVTHHILTEGISISFFYLFILCIFNLYLDEHLLNKQVILYSVGSFAFAILMALTRPQLFFIIIIDVFFLVLLSIKRKEICKNLIVKYSIVLPIMMIMMLLLSPVIIEKVLSIARSGAQIQDATSGRIICCAREEDAKTMDDDVRGIFIELYNTEKDLGHMRDNFGFKDRYADDLVYHTNEINKNCVQIITDNYQLYVNSKGEDLTPVGIRKTIQKELLHQHKKEYLIDTLFYAEKSMVASIFIQPDRIYVLCHIIAFVIHIFAISTYIICMNNNRLDEKYKWMFIIVYTILLANVIVTNSVMFGLQRYVIYTQGLFYVSIFLLLYKLYSERKA